MSKRTWQQLESRGGATPTTDTLYGGFKSSLGGIYIPSRYAESEGAHFAELINEHYSRGVRFSNVSQAEIYSDSTDDDLEYSTEAFKLKIAGVLGTYAGEVNKGPLTAAVANYVYADLSAFPTITVTSATTGWPATEHIELAIITPPASGPWIDQHLERRTHVHALSVAAAAASGSVVREFAYSTASPLLIGAVGAGKRVIEVEVFIETAFNAGTPTLSVGDAGNTSRLMATTDNNPLVADSYAAKPGYKYAAQTNVNLYITPSSASAGSGFVILRVA
jgi:hypothetical protein